MARATGGEIMHFYFTCLIVVWLVIIFICFWSAQNLFNRYAKNNLDITELDQEAHDLLNNTEISDEEFKKQLAKLRDKAKGLHVW